MARGDIFGTTGESFKGPKAKSLFLHLHRKVEERSGRRREGGREQPSGSGGQVLVLLLPGFRVLGMVLVMEREQFLTVDRHFAGRFDTQADFTAVDVHNRDTDVVADVDFLAQFTTEYQHGASSGVRISRSSTLSNFTSQSGR
jgi:hypothetical protein